MVCSRLSDCVVIMRGTASLGCPYIGRKHRRPAQDMSAVQGMVHGEAGRLDCVFFGGGPWQGFKKNNKHRECNGQSEDVTDAKHLNNIKMFCICNIL